jgi:DNA-binding protein YbaB
MSSNPINKSDSINELLFSFKKVFINLRDEFNCNTIILTSINNDFQITISGEPRIHSIKLLRNNFLTFPKNVIEEQLVTTINKAVEELESQLLCKIKDHFISSPQKGMIDSLSKDQFTELIKINSTINVEKERIISIQKRFYSQNNNISILINGLNKIIDLNISELLLQGTDENAIISDLINMVNNSYKLIKDELISTIT